MAAGADRFVITPDILHRARALVLYKSDMGLRVRLVRHESPTMRFELAFAAPHGAVAALGARLFFARPLEDLTNRTLELVDVLGADAPRWIDRLYDAGTWERRFDILDREIASRIAGARRPSPAVTWTWRELTRTAGSIKVRDLARDVGWSGRHLATQFRHEIGLGPRGFARVLRFGRAVRALTQARSIDLRDLALACGYHDQAHFTHDFRAFAGTTPTLLRENRFPDEAGFAAME